MQIVIVLVIAAVAVGVVLFPLLRKNEMHAGGRVSEEVLNEETRQYRNALKADTLCERCLYANPPKSRYCADCGTTLST